MRAGRGRLSSLDLLPPEAEEDVIWAYEQINKRKRTQDDIRDSLNTRLIARGLKPISRSAFNRAAVRTARMAHRLGEVREIAAAVASKFESGGDEDLTLLVSETIKSVVFEILEKADPARLKPDSFTAEMLANLALALKNAEAAKKISADVRTRIEKEFATKTGAAIEQVARAKGLTPETVEAIKAKILGVRAPLVLPPPETTS